MGIYIYIFTYTYIYIVHGTMWLRVNEWGRDPGIALKGLVLGGEARGMVSWLGHARKYLLAGTKRG